MKTRCALLLVLFFSCGDLLIANDFMYFPGAKYNPEIPTLKQVVGHDWGEKITSHAELQQYLKALSAATPKIQLVKYGETWEGRALYYLIVTSEANMAKIETIKTEIQKLADPRKISRTQAGNLIKSLPVITWLAYGVHGNEISSPEAGMLTAYHLVAAQDDTLAEKVLDNSVVIIDPLQNPDGRDRFVSYFRQTRSRWPDADQQAAEHNEDWPGGRTNHYLFDMNRDWFVQTQKETRGRVQAYLEWYPQVFVDLHEMGSNSTYYFPPPAAPTNPEMPAAQLNMLERFGKNIALWFDRMQFDYFSGEVFDSFYPGYGEGWPMFQGAVGMTFEQASSRGLVVRRDDETTMHYRDTIQHHFISSLATAETAARNREAMLRYFFEYRQSAINRGAQEKVKEYLLPPGSDPNRTAKLASILFSQGIEVKQASAAFSNSKVRNYYDGKLQSKKFPSGTYLISMAQPAKHLAKNLLAKHTPMDEKFIKEQLRRHEKRLGDEIYDITGWSLPLLFDVECYMTEKASRGNFVNLTTAPAAKGQIKGDKATLAYILPWGTNSAATALARIVQQGIRAFTADKAFTLNGMKFARGSIIIKIKNNPADLHQKLTDIAEETGVDFYPTNTSWVSEGIHFGSRNVRFLKKPKIAMAYHLPTRSYSVGWTRYLLEQAYGYPVTIINSLQLGRADLSKYNVLILPNVSSFYGGYSQAFGESGIRKIKAWVQNGGTLITFGEATRWLTGDKIGLLATSREYKGGIPEKSKPAEKSATPAGSKTPPKKSPPTAQTKDTGTFDVKKAIQPEKELPASTPGAIMRVKVDTEFWPAFGYDGDTNVLVASRNIFTPLKLDKGRNIGLYMPEDQVLVSGFVWEDSRKQIANKAYLMHQRHGGGNVLAFAEDPNFRAFCDGLNGLFLNAVFFGPAHSR